MDDQRSVSPVAIPGLRGRLPLAVLAVFAALTVPAAGAGIVAPSPDAHFELAFTDVALVPHPLHPGDDRFAFSPQTIDGIRFATRGGTIRRLASLRPEDRQLRTCCSIGTNFDLDWIAFDLEQPWREVTLDIGTFQSAWTARVELLAGTVDFHTLTTVMVSGTGAGRFSFDGGAFGIDSVRIWDIAENNRILLVDNLALDGALAPRQGARPPWPDAPGGPPPPQVAVPAMGPAAALLLAVLGGLGRLRRRGPTDPRQVSVAP